MRKIRWVKRKSLIEVYYAKEVGRAHTPNRAMLQQRVVNSNCWTGFLWVSAQDEFDAHYGEGTWKEVHHFPKDTPLPVMKKTMRAMLYLGMDTGI
jgi:hypothetical protein